MHSPKHNFEPSVLGIYTFRNCKIWGPGCHTQNSQLAGRSTTLGIQTPRCFFFSEKIVWYPTTGVSRPIFKSSWPKYVFWAGRDPNAKKKENKPLGHNARDATKSWKLASPQKQTRQSQDTVHKISKFLGKVFSWQFLCFFSWYGKCQRSFHSWKRCELYVALADRTMRWVLAAFNLLCVSATQGLTSPWGQAVVT